MLDISKDDFIEGDFCESRDILQWFILISSWFRIWDFRDFFRVELFNEDQSINLNSLINTLTKSWSRYWNQVNV